tara:strand:- start:363 stop:662 length:300 start_codon:yes stop_codon:yes gene_type:complete
MAPKKRSTAAFYASNPESYKKKLAYDKKRNSTSKAKKYRADLARERRARGIMGKGGKDVSHTAGGGFKLEDPKKNRARNGHGKNSKLAPGRGTRRQKKR